MPPTANLSDVSRSIAGEITRDYSALIEDVSTQERMVTARINTASVDRFNTVIDPMGADLSSYNKVVLWEHGRDPTRGALPIGSNRWIRAIPGSKPEIRARTQFGKDEYSQSLFEMYRDGMLSGWSIRALPKAGTFGPPTREEIRSRPELSTCETVYRKWELAEYSAVAVPGNADAMTLLEARGIWIPDDARNQAAKSVTVAAMVGADAQDEPDAEFRFIRKKGNKWVVYSESGKALGEHDSRESAVKQLQAIEAHKHDAGRSLITLRRALADDFTYMETRLMTRLRDLSDLLKGRV